MELEKLKLMAFEKKRLESFSNWIYKDKNVKCTAEKMAKAGFFVVSENEPGTVKCFVCLKQLDGWEENDDPFDEHKKHAPYCLFVKMGKPQEEFTLLEMVSLIEEADLRLFQYMHEEEKKEFLKKKNNIQIQLKN